MKHLLSALLFSFALFLTPAVKANATVLIVRHPMTSFIGEQFQKLVDEYNLTAEVPVVTEKFGDYKTGFEETVMASDFDQGPDILLGSEFTSTTMVRSHPDKYLPIHEFIDPTQLNLLPIIQGYYSFDGRLESLPFACSTAAVFYNKDKLASVGIDEIPTTWEKFAEMCRNFKFTFAIAWPMAYAFEHWSVVNGVPFSNPHNGFEDGEVHFKINREEFAKRLAFLRDLKNDGAFIYSKDIDRNEIPDFIEGKFDIVMNSANWAGFIDMKKPPFEVGVAPYPYNEEFIPHDHTPYALNVGGTSVWVMNKPHLNRDAVTDFLKFLAKPETQAKWHQLTGYVPTTYEAYILTKQQGFYKDHPAHKVAVEQVSRPNVKEFGIRANHYADIRLKIHEAIDKVLIEGQDIQTTLDQLVVDIDKIANS